MQNAFFMFILSMQLLLSTLKDPTLKPIDQNTMIFYNKIAVYDEFGGFGI
jgi:hypothetical protein